MPELPKQIVEIELDQQLSFAVVREFLPNGKLIAEIAKTPNTKSKYNIRDQKPSRDY